MHSVLLVDDSRSIRQLVSQALRRSRYEVHLAENGEVALNVARDEDIDLVLTDLNMPVMNGVELTKQLRTLPKHRDTPILLVTTESQLARKQEGKAAGATGWIVKPIPPPRLLEIVGRVLSK